VKILLSEQQLRGGVEKMADAINRDYANEPLTIIGVLTGSVVLLADLIRLLKMPLKVGVVQASSYREGTQRGTLTINSELMPDIRDHNVLLIDDIFDTGHTLKEVLALMKKMGPLSVKSAVLLHKVGKQLVELRPDYTGFEIPDEFVVGYGLDYRDSFRNLPYLAALESEDLPDE